MKTLSRTLLYSIPLLGLSALLTAGLVGCGPDSTGGGKTASAGDPLTVGFIYVGPKDDYGYNQAHAEGAAAVKKMDGVKVLEVEKVPETVDVQKTMKSMIEDDGAKLLFPTSFGYFDPHVLTVAKEYPNVMFLHCGGLWNKDKHPMNVGSYFGYIDECEYLSGIVAGYATKSKKLGFIAAKPIPQVRRNINAFTLGARSVDPSITCTVIFTGDWSMPVKESEAATSLIDQGVDVLTCHVDSPKVVIETARAAGDPLHRLPHQPGGPRPQRLPDRGGVELGEGLHRLRERHQGRQEGPEHAARRPEGADRQDVALRLGRERGGEEEGRRGQGQDHRRVFRDL